MKRSILSWFVTSLLALLLAGCDLSGFLPPAMPQLPVYGLTFTLQAAPLKAGESTTSEQLQATKTILEKRLTTWGFPSAQVQVQVIEGNKITVFFGVVGDRRAITLVLMQALIQRGFLEILNGGDNPPGVGLPVITELGGPPADESGLIDNIIWPVVATSDDLDVDKLSVQLDTTNIPEVVFTLNSAGTQKLADFTSNNIGKYMAIVIDKTVLSTPKIETAILGGSAVIVRHNLDEARDFADILKSDALPVNLRVLDTGTSKP